jgi:hypothetical protein
MSTRTPLFLHDATAGRRLPVKSHRRSRSRGFRCSRGSRDCGAAFVRRRPPLSLFERAERPAHGHPQHRIGDRTLSSRQRRCVPTVASDPGRSALHGAGAARQIGKGSSVYLSGTARVRRRRRDISRTGPPLRYGRRHSLVGHVAQNSAPDLGYCLPCGPRAAYAASGSSA